MVSTEQFLESQHTGILKLLSRIGMGGERLKTEHELVGELHRLLLHHFDAEESLLDRLPIPPTEALAHHQDHSRIIHMIGEIKQSVAKGELEAATQLMAGLASEIVEHETHYDVQYKPFLRSLIPAAA